MYVAYNDGTGAVTGINRRAEAGESEIEINSSELIWGMRSAFYTVSGGMLYPKEQSAVAAIIAQYEADAAAEVARVADIDSAQSTSGIKQYTIEQINTYLDNRFDAITDLDSAKVELRKIIDKMVPYLMG